ncbi:MAG: phospholipase D-like domain-containing protein [Chloroflexota bacterium]
MARWRAGAAGLLLLLFALIISWLGIPPPRSSESRLTEHDPSAPIAVYFSSPGRQPGSPHRIDEAFVRFVDGASRTLDVAVYLIDDPRVVSAIIRARHRGTSVRLVTDSDTLDRPKSNTVRAAMTAFSDAEIPIVGDQRPGIMHHKFAVRDAAEVWTGSWNMTEADSSRMNNAAVWLRSAELANKFTAEFEQMFTERRFATAKRRAVQSAPISIVGAPVEVYFQPGDRGLESLIRRVEDARQSVHFLAFSFTHDGLGGVLRSRASAGVEVSGVIERSGSESIYSELGAFRTAGVNVRTDANPSLMHHKTFIFDGRIVATGSMNYSLNVTRSNDENLVVIDDMRIARLFEQEFQAISDEALAGRLRGAAATARWGELIDDRPVE